MHCLFKSKLNPFIPTTYVALIGAQRKANNANCRYATITEEYEEEKIAIAIKTYFKLCYGGKMKAIHFDCFFQALSFLPTQSPFIFDLFDFRYMA